MSGLGYGNTMNWGGCAVDFDTGEAWFGLWDSLNRRMIWSPGADPSTNTLPDLTFTAASTMNIVAFTKQGGGSGHFGVVLVTEDGNVVGKPTTYGSWDGGTPSTTATPSGVTGGGTLWPYGVQT